MMNNNDDDAITITRKELKELIARILAELWPADQQQADDDDWDNVTT